MLEGTQQALATPSTSSPARRRLWENMALCAAVGVALAALSRIDYVAFHLVAEVAVVVVLCTMFTLAWRTIGTSTNGFLTVMGMAALPIAAVTVLHALAYRGMPALPGLTADAPTQLWLVARYLTAAALLVAAAFIARRPAHPGRIAGLFAVAAAAGVAAVLLRIFPQAFDPGHGLTPFKVWSEYAVIAAFAVALLLVWLRRADLDPRVARLLCVAILISILAELLFTTYTDVYGISNMLGHLAYLFAFYLLYLALVDEALRRPYEALFRELAVREQRLRRAHHFSEGLNEIDAAIHSTLDSDEILRRVVQTARRIIEADAAVLSVFDGERFCPRYFAGYTGEEFRDIDLDRDIGRHIFRARELGSPLAVDDVSGEPGVSRRLVEATGVRAILTNVLTVRDEVIGGLGFHWLQAPHQVTRDEIDFSRRVSSALSLALDNARAYARQHGIAEALQTDMASMAVDAPGVDVGQVYVPAPGVGRIGGDFYDVFLLDGGGFAFLLGDVIGHGLGAASKSAMARSTVRALAAVESDPGVVLERAGHVLAQQFENGEFATAVFGVLDPGTGRGRIAVAGHPFPLVFPRHEPQPPVARSLPLGVEGGAGCTSAPFRLRPGDTLLLFTDGAYEARRGGEFFGEARLIDATSRASGLPTAQAAADAVVAEIKAFAGEVRDDLALLALRYVGISGPAAAPQSTAAATWRARRTAGCRARRGAWKRSDRRRSAARGPVARYTRGRRDPRYRHRRHPAGRRRRRGGLSRRTRQPDRHRDAPGLGLGHRRLGRLGGGGDRGAALRGRLVGQHLPHGPQAQGARGAGVVRRGRGAGRHRRHVPHPGGRHLRRVRGRAAGERGGASPRRPPGRALQPADVEGDGRGRARGVSGCCAPPRPCGRPE